MCASQLPRSESLTPPIIPADEPERLKAVRRYDILDTPPDGAFDRLSSYCEYFIGSLRSAMETLQDRKPRASVGSRSGSGVRDRK